MADKAKAKMVLVVIDFKAALTWVVAASELHLLRLKVAVIVSVSVISVDSTAIEAALPDGPSRVGQVAVERAGADVLRAEVVGRAETDAVGRTGASHLPVTLGTESTPAPISTTSVPQFEAWAI
jgi:hypothetical protein